jgi:hydrogenase maturation protease
VTSAAQSQEILILGVGNPLMGDDGAGVWAVELLEQCDLPDHVRVSEIGTPGWGLGAWFENQTSVVLIDAVKMGLEPGAWQKIDLHTSRLFLHDSALSLHQADLACGLLLAQELDLLPQNLTLYGIEPACLEPGSPLSPQIKSSLTELVHAIVIDFWRKT